MTYDIVINPRGQRRWWACGIVLPHDYVLVRPATSEEAALIKELLTADGNFDDVRMDTAASKLRVLIED